ncbi:ABSCISIC ACID-INSENSITIVE 5-like protein 2 [Phragmites australis]|uniref:ABSCISIC ACID-INSENSITIVE 5-like protein 2 n=1 Tax=Phragmites australis TaxID=29695 RepID=UPI002D785EFD|nr:ABSCISIC ACID-INSENSITIVE 5-like protein 2 [Phragmites australis]
MGAKAMSSHGSGAGGGALSRQGSVCSLTFSEVDGQLHGVNLDELLRAAGSGKKTVDEVWRDIQGAGGCPRAQMTLEDFLSRAGAPADAADTDARSWAQQYQPAPAQLGHHPTVGRPVPRPLGVGAGPVLDALYHEGNGGCAAAAGRKRAAGAEGAVVERSTVERRKKRMIKNRESAARSRARKQAYTNELENKISRLEEENERLRRHKAPEPVVQYVPQLEIKNQLRRTNSANF